jgi:TorA maturation chaperone TorD
MTAAAPTLAVLPAAADEVSASVAHLFSQRAADYQAQAAQAAFQEQFVQNLTASAGPYASIEDFIAWSLGAAKRISLA